MPEATTLEQQVEVVLEVSEWYFLTFDLPLRHNAPPTPPNSPMYHDH